MNTILAVLNFMYACLVFCAMLAYEPWKKRVVEMVIYGITFILPIISGIALLV